MQLIRVLLYVKDLLRMTHFYSAVLGSEPSHTEDQYVEFENGRLALHAIPAEIGDQMTPPHRRETTPIRLIFQTHNLSNETARLRELGATLERRPWGAYVAIDPEGNIFEITVQETRALS